MTILISPPRVRDAGPAWLQQAAGAVQRDWQHTGCQGGLVGPQSMARFAMARLTIAEMPAIPHADRFGRITLTARDYLRDHGYGLIRVRLYPIWSEPAFTTSYRVSIQIRGALPGCEVVYEATSADFSTEGAALDAAELRLKHIIAIGRALGGAGLQTRCELSARQVQAAIGDTAPAGATILIPYARNRRGGIGYRTFMHGAV